MAAEGGSCAESGRAKSLGGREPGAGTRQETAWVEAGSGAEGGMGTLAAVNSLRAVSIDLGIPLSHVFTALLLAVKRNTVVTQLSLCDGY